MYRGFVPGMTGRAFRMDRLSVPAVPTHVPEVSTVWVSGAYADNN